MRPIPKKPRPTILNDFRPIALTSVAMKSMERLVLNRLLRQTSDQLDPLQFAYRHNRSVEDALITMLNLIFEHLERPKSYVRVLFADLSSAFNTIKPHILARKLLALNVSREIVLWVLNFLTDRRQYVSVGDVSSSLISTSCGSPQGCVLSAVLFILYTNDCRSSTEGISLIKFSDDSSIVDCSGSVSDYEREAEKFFSWCQTNSLHLNVSKTVELIFDFRRSPQQFDPLVLDGLAVERTEVIKYLGTHVDSKLCFTDHVNQVCKKAHSRLYMLRKLRSFGVKPETLKLFYSSFIESLLTFSFLAWYGSLGLRDLCRLRKIVQLSEKVVGVPLRSLDMIFLDRTITRCGKILQDDGHILAQYFVPLPSGRRYKAPRVKTKRYGSSFIPSAVRLLNQKSGRA